MANYPRHLPNYNPLNAGKLKFPDPLASKVRAVMRDLWQTTARESEKRTLYLNAREIDGYAAAEESAFQAAEQWFKSEGLVFDELDSLYGSGLAEETSLFFFSICSDPAETLKQFAPLVKAAASRGDVKFFQRVCAQIRNAKRRRSTDSLRGHLLIHWIASSLWLASDNTGSTYLQQVLKKTVEENSYARARSRLRLKGYDDVGYTKPLITGCTRRHKFIITPEWTNLEPKLSR